MRYSGVPGGLEIKVARLLKEYDGLRTAYSPAIELVERPEQLDFIDLTSRL